MKLEIKLNGESKAENPENVSSRDDGLPANRPDGDALAGLPAAAHEEKEEASIDIASVLAANQALLKNISLKMESLENRVSQLETCIRRQTKAIKMDKAKTQLLLEPPKQVKAWEPDYPKLDEKYFSNFSFIDRWLNPQKLRRKGADN